MSKERTTATLFDHAVTVENKAQEFYLALSKKFAHVPEVAEFWEGMMNDEMSHARELERIRGSLSQEQLTSPANPRMLEVIDDTPKRTIAEKLEPIKNLDDAYTMVHEAENSEATSVFEFLTREFISSEDRKNFVKMAMEEHLSKLDDFTKNFGNAEWRRSVMAK